MLRSNPWSTNAFIGKPVRNVVGETLGKVDDLIVDPSTGNITFAVLSFGGLLGMGDKLVAVPWRALNSVSGRDYLTVDLDKSVLQRAPAFERGQWPDVTDETWRSRTYSYYGYPKEAVARDRTVVVERDYRPRRRGLSSLAAAFLVMVLAGLLALSYMISTRGWDQTRNDLSSSAQGVAYAMKETSGDAAVSAKVKTALSLNRRVPSGSINVDSQDGIVTLRGEVADEQTRQTAQMIAQDTPGVREVRNHLYVMSPGNR
jgi:sporulation protein YlmC with PRC-barrel domain